MSVERWTLQKWRERIPDKFEAIRRAHLDFDGAALALRPHAFYGMRVPGSGGTTFPDDFLVLDQSASDDDITLFFDNYMDKTANSRILIRDFNNMMSVVNAFNSAHVGSPFTCPMKRLTVQTAGTLATSLDHGLDYVFSGTSGFYTLADEWAYPAVGQTDYGIPPAGDSTHFPWGFYARKLWEDLAITANSWLIKVTQEGPGLPDPNILIDAKGDISGSTLVGISDSDVVETAGSSIPVRTTVMNMRFLPENSADLTTFDDHSNSEPDQVGYVWDEETHQCLNTAISVLFGMPIDVLDLGFQMLEEAFDCIH